MNIIINNKHHSGEPRSLNHNRRLPSCSNRMNATNQPAMNETMTNCNVSMNAMTSQVMNTMPNASRPMPVISRKPVEPAVNAMESQDKLKPASMTASGEPMFNADGLDDADINKREHADETTTEIGWQTSQERHER